MVRIKGGTTANKHRKSVLKQAKGYRFGRSNKERQAREAIYHAGNHAFAHRRRKKGDFRRLWTIRINAAVRPHGLSYSQFIGVINTQGFGINRKMLQQIAIDNPEAFDRIVEEVKKHINTSAPAKKAEKPVENSVEEKPAKKASVKPDDLTKIEGIGPKIASTLTTAGVATFADLAKTSSEKIAEIITDVRGSHDPTTWPKQAKMAADEKWDELKKWQDELDGGKA